MSLLKHSLTSGAKNFTRNIWLSLTAVSVLAISLSAVGLLSLLSTSLEYAILTLDKQVNIVVFFQDQATLDNVKSVENDLLRTDPNRNFEIVSTKIFSKEEEKADLLRRNPRVGLDVFELIGNPLSFKLEIQPKSIDQFQGVADFLKQDRYNEIILSINNPSVIITNLQRLNTIAKTTGFIVITVFAIISILVMVNILRLAIYNRREEIEIMRLVGATNAYIQGPFVVEGVLYNLAAASIFLLIFIPFFGTISPFINNYLSSAFVSETAGDTTQFSTRVFINLAVNILAGLIIGILTIYLAIQRYLKK